MQAEQLLAVPHDKTVSLRIDVLPIEPPTDRIPYLGCVRPIFKRIPHHDHSLPVIAQHPLNYVVELDLSSF